MKIREICNITMGQSPSSATYNENGDGLPFFQGAADFGKKFPMTRVWCSSPLKIAYAGDILISVRAPVGTMNIATSECCIGRGLAAIKVDEDACDSNYFWFALESKISELNNKGSGSTFKAISKSILEETEIPLPELEEQRKIAKILTGIENISFARQQQLAKLDELVKARFVEMFGNVIHNDKNWEKYHFSDITSSRLGKMLDAKQQTGKHPFPYLANANVQWFRFETDNLNRMDFNETEQVEFSLKDGDLLVCEGGEIGRCAVWHDQVQPCYFQKALHRVRCNQEIIVPDYLAWWFKFNCENNGFAAIEGAKATIAHLPGAKLKQLLVVVPSIELQYRFVDFIEQTDMVKVSVQKSLEQLETLKKALMQKYFG